MIFPKAAWESRVKATAVHWIFTSSRPFCVIVRDGLGKTSKQINSSKSLKLPFLLILMRQVHLVHIFKITGQLSCDWLIRCLYYQKAEQVEWPLSLHTKTIFPGKIYILLKDLSEEPTGNSKISAQLFFVLTFSYMKEKQ